jgi:glycosyltransferase involved in cell wall biosynthesis
MADKQQALVSICIPTYNVATTLRETLRSIVSQTYANLDIRIVDNASTDATLAVAGEFDDSRISVHAFDVNVGGEGNFNRCIQLAKGEYTAIFHADDVYEPDMVAEQVAFFEAHRDVGAVFTSASVIDENGARIGMIQPPEPLTRQGAVHAFPELFKAVLRYSNFLICPSAMVRSDVFKDEIHGWRGEMFKTSADLDVWLRIAQRHPVGILTQPLMRYRISGSQGSAMVRLQTERADFFLVTDHYLADDAVRRQLSARDLCNFNRLERRDRVMRAANLLMAARAPEADALLSDLFSCDALIAALTTCRGLAVFALGCYLKILRLFSMNRLGQLSLGYMKRVLRK